MTNYFQIYSFSWKWGVTEVQLGKFSLMESNPLQQIENVCSKIVKSISTPDFVVGNVSYFHWQAGAKAASNKCNWLIHE